MDVGAGSDVHIAAARLNGGHRKKQRNVIAKKLGGAFMRLPAFWPAARSAAPASVIQLRLVLEDRAGGVVDLVAV